MTPVCSAKRYARNLCDAPHCTALLCPACTQNAYLPTPAHTRHIGPPRGGRLLAGLLPRTACAGVGSRGSALQGGRHGVDRGSACRRRATTLQRKHTAGVRYALRAMRI